EKPLAPSLAECQAIQNAAQKAQRYLMVAYRLHFDEATLKAIDIAQSGKLGELRLFSSFFSHVVRPGDIRTRDELAGGALLDLGVYCVNAARNLFRAEPISVSAQIIERDGADDTTSATLGFPGDRIAQFVVSNSTAAVSSYRIAGTEGSLRVEPGYEYREPIEFFLTVGDSNDHYKFDVGDQFGPELVYFSNCILQSREPEPSAEEGILDIRVIEAIFQAARTGTTVKLEPRTRGRRPNTLQIMHKPAVGKQETVHSESPSIK
ncbi:MAG TPA: Gfo/Idh/MocA family oxidoreductase, partial [Polyangiaceae bacterium]|nr:Gfo/Idh/MocA family oxidoreductase [Polyangiaceae bacterium]